MASSLLTLLDDIASLLDDVATMTKVATKKTAGVLGDDLALNAQQVAGVHTDRELPVVWAVAVGSVRNKALLVPAALAISALAPALITPLLMLGGAFLCFEGVEKLAHRWLQPTPDEAAQQAAGHAAHRAALIDPTVDLVALEREKIRGAVRTDFILSAEIIVIALGSVAGATLGQQLAVLVSLSVLMTVGVYGLVAAIVKLDDAGLWLSQRGGAQAALGRGLLRGAPWLMKGLSVAGTAAMFLVGGGILAHGLGPWHHALAAWAEGAGLLGALAALGVDAGVGVLAGALILAGVQGLKRLKAQRA